MLQDQIRSKGLRQAALAEACQVTEGTMSKWLTGKTKVPAEKVALVSRATGLPAHEIRPDVFPQPPEALVIAGEAA